jgi:hypothetical protein
MMIKVLVVIGTRPEAIKMAPVVKELQSRGSAFDVSVCLTAQHREMLDQVINLFKIPVAYDLNLMKPNQDLSDLTSLVLLGMGRRHRGFETGSPAGSGRHYDHPGDGSGLVLQEDQSGPRRSWSSHLR